MKGNPSTSWPKKVIVSLLGVVAVAIGARIADVVLTPLVPLLITAIALMAVFALLLRWWRW